MDRKHHGRRLLPVLALAIAACSGSGDGNPPPFDPSNVADCSWAPTSLDFGAVPLGESNRASVLVWNPGTASLSATVNVPCSDFAVMEGPPGAFELAPGDSVVVTLEYAPSVAGTHDCELTLGTECDALALTGEARAVTPTVSFAADIQPIFTASCTASCHTGPSPVGNVDLSAGASYAALVNVVSEVYTPERQVTRFEPNASILYHKVADTGIYGGLMPPGAVGLSAGEIDLIRTWIEEGATDN